MNPMHHGFCIVALALLLGCNRAPEADDSSERSNSSGTRAPRQTGMQPILPPTHEGSEPIRVPAPDSLKPGLLIVPFEDAGDSLRGQSGDLIRFQSADSTETAFDIELAGKLYRDVWSVELVPLDSTLVPYYLYRVLSSGGPKFRETPAELSYAPRLAARARELFPQHPYADHFAALECRAVYREELMITEGKVGLPRSLVCVRQYLQEFPRGKHRDELEWLRVRLEHWTYEFGGSPEPPLAQARAFEAYLAKRPQHAERTAIQLRVAELYSIAHECIRERSEGAEGFSDVQAAAYRAKAESIYSGLVQNPDPGVSSEARVRLHNLRSGRRIYLNPNAW